MKDFHKRKHLRQFSFKEFGVNVNDGNNLKEGSKARKAGQLQENLQSGNQSSNANFSFK